MKLRIFWPLIVLAMLAVGCPRRQTGLRVVYTPPPPLPAGQQSQAGPVEAMVIEEPPPPEPAQLAPAKPVEAASTPPARLPRRRASKPVSSPPPESTPAAVPTGAPALQPSIRTADATGLRERTNSLTRRLQMEIVRLRRRALPSADRKTLHDAELFLDQAVQAFQAGDFQRSSRLEHKADLLVSAVRNR